MLGARHGAGERVAHAHGERGRRRLVFLHHVEMGVEGRDLVDLGERELHLSRERGEMRGGKVPVAGRYEVQVRDQEVVLARAFTEQRAYLFDRLQVELPTLGGAPRAPPAAVTSAVCR